MRTGRIFRILHLSDLHFTADAGKDREVRSWCDSLLTDIKGCLPRGPQSDTFIVISGDLTFSGQKSEFKAAGEFLSTLLLATQVPKNQLLLVPGNHDISRLESSRWRRKAFFDCASNFLPEGDSPHAPFRWFEKQGVVFLMPGVLEEADAADLSRIWRHAGERYSNDLRVAVTHYPLDWMPEDTRGDREQDDAWWLESASRRFLAEATPQLHLFGHLHSERRSLWSQDAKHSFLAAGSGPLSCESWRRDLAGPPSYRLITVSEKKIQLRTRVFLSQSRRWVDERLLPAEAGPDAARRTIQRSEGKRKDYSIDRLCDLSQYDMFRFVNELGAAVEPYSPVRESREEFARRFVDYFAREGRLEYLDRCLSLFDQKGSDQRLRVFVLATPKGRAIGQLAAKLCKVIGVEAVWTEYETSAGGGLDEKMEREIRAADILLVVVSEDFARSPWIAREVGFALQHSGALAPRVVPIIMPGVRLPEPLKGLNLIEADNAEEIRADKLTDAISTAAKELLNSSE